LSLRRTDLRLPITQPAISLLRRDHLSDRCLDWPDECLAFALKRDPRSVSPARRQRNERDDVRDQLTRLRQDRNIKRAERCDFDPHGIAGVKPFGLNKAAEK
jgi:hypothetical protein